jgi:hypothetical protein
MPIQYRKYHIRKINDYIEKQNEEYENARGNKTIKNIVNKPNIPQADFSSKIKAPKK